MHIDEYKNPQDGRYYLKNGSSWAAPEMFILEGLFGFCGCGRPDDCLEYIRDALQWIEDGTNLPDLPIEGGKWASVYQPWNKKGEAQFGGQGGIMFICYIFDKWEFTEHGGSVPGWLDEKGHHMLDDLNEILGQPESVELFPC